MILLQNLVKRYADRVVLDAVSYHFPAKSRVALIGSNGAGKSTLLNILCALDEADGGTVVRPKNCILGYLPQEPSQTPKPTILEECLEGASTLSALKHDLESALVEMGEHYSDALYERYEKLETAFRDQGGYAIEAEAKGILVGLGFSTAQFDASPLILSGGWRMRLELAKILVKNPNFLVLDEPTNHLDLPSMIWLEGYLERFAGTLVFVSHDQELLNRLSTITLHLSDGRMTPYTGNFDSFLEQHELRQQQSQQASKHLEQQSAHVEKFIERFRGKPTKAAQVRSRYKMLARIQSLQDAAPTTSEEGEIAFSIPLRQASGRHVLTLKQASIGYKDRELAKNLSLAVQRGQKIAIIGANGIGKSTLIKSIAGVIPFLSGTCELGHQVKLGYYAQEQLDYLDPHQSALENVMSAGAGITPQRARALLGGFLIRRDDVFKSLKVMSGGEKSRVGLAHLLAQDSNFLIMDEPTNHLDMLSTNVLGQALSEFEGTALFVSHNRHFINAVATHIFAMTANGRSQLCEGTLDDYVAQAERTGFPNVLKA